MKQENRALLIKYAICFGVAAFITVMIFGMKGFFTDSVAVNIQILSDGFSVSGMIFLFLAGMLYISGEGGFIGIGFVLKSVAQIFVPMGRKHHEMYAQYRERQLSKIKHSSDFCVLITGVVFFGIGLLMTVIWYVKFYNI